jgi:hypothetical protein
MRQSLHLYIADAIDISLSLNPPGTESHKSTLQK